MAELKIPAEEAIALITRRLEDLEEVRTQPGKSPYYLFVGWCSETWRSIDRIYGPDNFRAEEIRSAGMPSCSCSSPEDIRTAAGPYRDLLAKYRGEIRERMAGKHCEDNPGPHPCPGPGCTGPGASNLPHLPILNIKGKKILKK